MTTDTDLERRYRRWLRWYPKAFRNQHESEVIEVLMASAREGQREPMLIECVDLISSAVRMRLRPSLPRSDQSALTAVKVMFLGAALQLVTAGAIWRTMAEVKSNIVKRSPGLTKTQWHAVAVGQLEPVAVAASLAVGAWLWMAWANGRGHTWGRIVFAVFFGVNTLSLLNGLIHGSAIYAPTDLYAAVLLWLVELVALVTLLHEDVRRIIRRSRALAVR